MNGDNPQQPDTNQDQSPWQYNPSGQTAAPGPVPAPPAGEALNAAAIPPLPMQLEVSWTASEFVAHEKGVSWFGLFSLAVVAIAAIVYFVTRDYFSSGVIVMLAVLVGITAARKPREVVYHVDSRGVTIGQKFRPYDDFHSFSIIEEGPFSTISFAPLKRFAVPLNIYYSPDDEGRIVEVLAQHLPVEQRGHDAIDNLARRIRF